MSSQHEDCSHAVGSHVILQVMMRLQQSVPELETEGRLSFEFRALESILEQLCEGLRSELAATERWGGDVMHELQHKGGRFAVLDRLRMLKNDVDSLVSRVTSMQG